MLSTESGLWDAQRWTRCIPCPEGESRGLTFPFYTTSQDMVCGIREGCEDSDGQI